MTREEALSRAWDIAPPKATLQEILKAAEEILAWCNAPEHIAPVREVTQPDLSGAKLKLLARLKEITIGKPFKTVEVVRSVLAEIESIPGRGTPGRRLGQILSSMEGHANDVGCVVRAGMNKLEPTWQILKGQTA
jgi:hypothetical protein